MRGWPQPGSRRGRYSDVSVGRENSGETVSRKRRAGMSSRRAAENMNMPRLAPHDLRRSCARLCHDSGGELEQIQFLLGHVSVQTTERYIGCQQRLRIAVNDRLGIEPG